MGMDADYGLAEGCGGSDDGGGMGLGLVVLGGCDFGSLAAQEGFVRGSYPPPPGTESSVSVGLFGSEGGLDVGE
jgi:hypothetical protein